MLESVVLLSDVVPTPLRSVMRNGNVSKLRICGASIRWDVASLILLPLLPVVMKSALFMPRGLQLGEVSVIPLLLVGNSLLVLQLLRQLTQNGWVAWVFAVLFLLHPNSVEGAESIAAILPTTFLLSGAVCWLKRERTSRDEGWGTVWLLLGLASHAPVVVLPPLVLAFDVIIVRRSFVESLFRQLIPVFFCVMLILAMMNAQVTLIDGLRNHNGLCKWRLLALDSNLLCRYAAMLLAPQDLSVLYNPPLIGVTGLILVAVVAWGLLASWIWSLRRWEPLMTIAGLVWYLAVVPMIELLSFKPLLSGSWFAFVSASCAPPISRKVSGLRKSLERLTRNVSDLRGRREGCAIWEKSPGERTPVILGQGMRIQIP